MAGGSSKVTRRDFLKLAGTSAILSDCLPRGEGKMFKTYRAADHVLVGTDYPFGRGDWMGAEKIQTMECGSSEREAMLHRNARKLLKL
jgi:predicted TIM-barrel fold metal-dependent hydrolase